MGAARALNFSWREVWERKGPQQREPPLWCITHGQVQIASKALTCQTSRSFHSCMCLQPSMWSGATNFKCQPAPLNKYVPVHWHCVLNTHSMPMLSNKASHKLECNGRFSSFYPFGRQCDFQSKGFIFASQAARLPQKHSPVYDIRRMQKQNGSPHRTWSCRMCCTSQHWSACSAYVTHASSHQACRGRQLRETDPHGRLGSGLKKQQEAQWSGDKAQRAMALQTQTCHFHNRRK